MAIVGKDTIKKLKTEGKYTLEYTLNPEVVAHITYVMQSDNTIKIRAYLLSQNPRQRIKEVAEKAGTAHNFATLEVTTRNLCTDLMAKLDVLQNPPKKVIRPRSATEFSKVIIDIPGIMEPLNYKPYVKRGWGKATAETAVSYYARTIGKVYEQYGWDADESDFEEFKSQQVDKIYASQYKAKSTDVETVQRLRETIYNSVNDRFTAALSVQKFLLEHHPEIGVPTTPIPVSMRTSRRGKEQVKAITKEQYINLCAILQQLCIANVPYAYAVLLEVICGARIGESCAPLIGDFEFDGNCGRYYIGHQVDGKGQRTDVLKNVYSYRFVFFGCFVIDMIAHRVEQLEQMGYSKEDIALMPLASMPSSPAQFLPKAKASTFLRMLLGLVGCDERWLEQEAARMYAIAAATGDGDDLEVCAHTLRSTFATFCGNGGFDADTVDAILGHKNDNNRKKDYASWQTAREICAKIERCIYLGSLCETQNPAYHPIEVDKPQNFQLGGNMRYQFEITEDTYVTLDMRSMEPSSNLRTILNDSGAINIELEQRIIPDTPEDRATRPILQPLLDRKLVEQWIAEAKEIDLSRVIYKYGVLQIKVKP